MNTKEFRLATFRGKMPMKGNSVANKSSTKPGKYSVSHKLKSPISGKAATMYHASRGKTAPKLSAFAK